MRKKVEMQIVDSNFGVFEWLTTSSIVRQEVSGDENERQWRIGEISAQITHVFVPIQVASLDPKDVINLVIRSLEITLIDWVIWFENNRLGKVS